MSQRTALLSPTHFKPAPTSSNLGACSNTSTFKPARPMAQAAASPPIPPPIIAIDSGAVISLAVVVDSPCNDKLIGFGNDLPNQMASNMRHYQSASRYINREPGHNDRYPAKWTLWGGRNPHSTSTAGWSAGQDPNSGVTAYESVRSAGILAEIAAKTRLYAMVVVQSVPRLYFVLNSTRMYISVYIYFSVSILVIKVPTPCEIYTLNSSPSSSKFLG